MNKNKNTLPG